jgi:hypothetical protein
VVLFILVHTYIFKITPGNPSYEKLRLGNNGFSRAKNLNSISSHKQKNIFYLDSIFKSKIGSPNLMLFSEIITIIV